MSQEIVRGLNELLEAERAGVELATDLARVVSKGYAEGELRKFKGDEAWACTGLRGAIIRYGGMPSERISDFAEKVLALGTEGEQLKLLARGQAWVVKRIDLLLQLGLYSETAAFLMEMRQQHLENMDVCVRRASELAAPPSVPYRGLPFARLREAHDQMFYAAWREPSWTVQDLQRAYRQLGRYVDVLSHEVERSRSAEAKTHLAKAMKAFAEVDPEVYAERALKDLDAVLSCCHLALNSLLRHHGVPPHDPRDFEVFHDVRNVPFHLIDDFYR